MNLGGRGDTFIMNHILNMQSREQEIKRQRDRIMLSGVEKEGGRLETRRDTRKLTQRDF